MSAFAVATRPPKGTKGEPFHVSTNCFRVNIVKPMSYYHYHVVIQSSRAIKNLNVRRRKAIVTKLYTQVAPDVFQPGHVVYNGQAGLFTSKDLQFAERKFEVNEMNTPPDPTRGLFELTLTHVGNVQSRDYEALLKREGQTENAETFQQVLNLLLHNSTPAEFRRVATRTTLFSGTNVINLSGFELWRGCFASVRPSFDHALLNVDVSCAIMYERGDLVNVSMNLLGCRNPRELERPDTIPRLQSLLKGVRVRQVHSGKIGRIRSIKKLVAQAGRHVFHLQEGSQTTVQQYFLISYRYTMKFPDLPGIIVKKTDKENDTFKTDVIPLELLDVIEGQMFKKRLDPILQGQVHKLTTSNPQARMRTIMKYLQAFNPDALALAGLHIEKNLVSVPGRRLPAPQIHFAQKRYLEPDQGEWQLSRRSPMRLFKPCILKAWAVICYDNRLSPEFCHTFLSKLLSCMDALGMQTNTLKAALRNGRTVMKCENAQGDILKHLQVLIADMRKLYVDFKPSSEFLLLVILPHSASTLHRQIKEIGDTGPGVVTQCMISDKLERLSDPYLFNLLLKINVKLGGINYVPLGGGMEWVHDSKEPIMIVGADVSHPGPGILRPSVAGLVSSLDEHASKYVASCTFQEPRREIIQNLRPMFYKALLQFNKHLKGAVLPFRIIVYRDGVSDGEFRQVAEEEIRAIKDAIARVWKEAPSMVRKPPVEKVKVTFVVVGKRHHIRFFPPMGHGDKSGNCPSGFVADVQDIANPNVYDFFLQSHAGRLGTSRPAHYIVIKDENNFSSDELQALSFSLCHTFCRATRAVSIPAPVYYADLVCRRADIHLRYKGDDYALSTMESGDAVYDPADWEFTPVQKMQEDLMYFI